MKMPGGSSMISRFLNEEEKRDLLLRLRYGNLMHGHRSVSSSHLSIQGQAVSVQSNPQRGRFTPRPLRSRSARAEHHTTPEIELFGIKPKTSMILPEEESSAGGKESLFPQHSYVEGSISQALDRTEMSEIEEYKEARPIDGNRSKFNIRFSSSAGDARELTKPNKKLIGKTTTENDSTQVKKSFDDKQVETRSYNRRTLRKSKTVLETSKIKTSASSEGTLTTPCRRMNASNLIECKDDSAGLNNDEKVKKKNFSPTSYSCKETDKSAASFIKSFYEMPASKPKSVCFDHPGFDLTYVDVKEAIERVVPSALSHNKVVLIQFENINVKFGTSSASNRWHIELKDFATRNKLIKTGLMFRSRQPSHGRRNAVNSKPSQTGSRSSTKYHVPVQLYDQVAFEEYKSFLQHHQAEEELQSTLLLTAGRGQHLLSNML